MQTTLDIKQLSPEPWTESSVRLLSIPLKAVSLNAHRNTWWPRLSQNGMLPVIGKNKVLKGVLRQDLLLMGDALPPLTLERAEQLLSSTPASIQSHQTIGEALVLFEQFNLSLIPIVDAKGRYTGDCASYMQWYRLHHGLLRPARVGGFATPFGVYLTSGALSGGVGWKALAATGVLFGIGAHILAWGTLIAFSLLAACWPELNLLNIWQQGIVQAGLQLMGLCAVIRFSPISALHAAEHMTVSAIEQDLPLTPENVRLQPREHQRCGTNLMILLGSLFILTLSLWVLQTQVNLLGLILYTLLWVSITLVVWRPIGLWVQRHFTTKPPNEAQLASGLRAGAELLSQFTKKPHPRPTLWQRIWSSQIIPLLAVSALTTWVLEQLIIAFS